MWWRCSSCGSGAESPCNTAWAGTPRAWSAGYAIFVLLCSGAALYSLRVQERAVEQGTTEPVIDEGTPPTWREYGMWLALPAMGTWLLLSVSNHMIDDLRKDILAVARRKSR